MLIRQTSFLQSRLQRIMDGSERKRHVCSKRWQESERVLAIQNRWERLLWPITLSSSKVLAD